MMVFTFLFTLVCFAFFFCYTFVPNYNLAHGIINYFYFIVSLQTWLFAFNYLESIAKCSFVKDSFSKFLPLIKWIGIVSYAVTLAVIEVMAFKVGYNPLPVKLMNL